MTKSLFECTSFKLKALLNMTKVKLVLIPNAEMYLFFEKGMCGGVSYISKRYIKANSRYLKSYDLIIFMVMLCLDFFQ